jgi:hypothetical protein
MEIEDGVIWVYGVGEDGVLAFTDFGIENLVELVRVYKQYPELLRRADPPAAYAGFQLPTNSAPTMAPNAMSVRRDRPRHMTVLPGGGSLARAR